jgi:hypothetical protein
MPGILTERRQIVNCSSFLRTDRSQFGPSWRLSGERRDQTVDQASDLAAGIVVGVDLGDDQAVELAAGEECLQTGEEAFDRLNPTFGVPADRSDRIGHLDLAQREAAVALGVRVAVHDARQNDLNPIIWQPGQDYRMADALQAARTQPSRTRRGPERLGPER